MYGTAPTKNRADREAEQSRNHANAVSRTTARIKQSKRNHASSVTRTIRTIRTSAQWQEGEVGISSGITGKSAQQSMCMTTPTSTTEYRDESASTPVKSQMIHPKLWRKPWNQGKPSGAQSHDHWAAQAVTNPQQDLHRQESQETRWSRWHDQTDEMARSIGGTGNTPSRGQRPRYHDETTHATHQQV